MARNLDLQLKIQAVTEGLSDLKKTTSEVNKLSNTLKKPVDNKLQKGVEDIGRAGPALKKLNASLKNVSSGLKTAGSSISGFGAKLTGVSNLFAGLFGAQSIAAFGQQAKAVAQVEAALASMGDVSGKTSEELQKTASALQANSLFGDEQILGEVTSNLLTFGNVTGETFDRAQQAIVDFAAQSGTDLKSATIQIAKALNDPAKGLSALSRSGTTFTAEQEKLIKSLVKTGDAAKAQDIILKELETQYGGVAAAIAKDGIGPLVQLKNSFGDLTEEVGKVLVEFLAPVTEAIKGLVDSFINLDGPTKKIIVGLGLVAAAAGPALIAIGGIVSLAGSGIGALASMGGALAKLAGGFKLANLGALAFKAALASIGVGVLLIILQKVLEIKEEFGTWERTMKAIWLKAQIAFLEFYDRVVNTDFGEVFDNIRKAIVNAFVTAYNFVKGQLGKFAAFLGLTDDSPAPVEVNINTESAEEKLKRLKQELANLKSEADSEAQSALSSRSNVGRGPLKIPDGAGAATSTGAVEIPATVKVKSVNLDEQKLQAAQTQIQAAFSQIEAQTLQAQRTLTGGALEEQMARVRTLGQQSLNSLRSNLVQTIQSISDPNILAAFENKIVEVGSGIQNLQAPLSETQLAVREFGASAAQAVGNNLANSLNSVLSGAASAKDAFKDLALSVIQDLQRIAIQKAITAAIKAIGFSGGGEVGGDGGGGFARGGLIPAFASGGRIPRYDRGGKFQNFPNGFLRGPGTSTSDSILARVSRGEFVQRGAAVRKYGVDFMDAINSLNTKKAMNILGNGGRNVKDKFANGGLIRGLSGFQRKLTSIKLPRFNDGGLVDGAQQNVGTNAQGINVQIQVQNNGTEKNATVTDQKLDGRNLVVTLMLEDLKSNGQVSKGIQNAFGIRRPGR